MTHIHLELVEETVMKIPTWTGWKWHFGSYAIRVHWFRVFGLIGILLIPVSLNQSALDPQGAPVQENIESSVNELERDLETLRRDDAGLKKSGYDADCEGLDCFVLSGTPRPAIPGKLLDISSGLNPELLLVDIGLRDGLIVGDNLTIYRGSYFVGRATVRRLEETMAACSINFLAEGMELKIGDSVNTRVP